MPPVHVTPNLPAVEAEEPTQEEKTGGSGFYFALCQRGAEPAIKKRLLEPNGPFRLAFSRPGILTLKSSAQPSESGILLDHWLIRQFGQTLGQFRGESAENLAQQVIELAGQNWDAVHVCQRDSHLPGERGFEPGPTPLTEVIYETLLDRLPGAKSNRSRMPDIGQNVLDVILVEPDQWIIAHHTVREIHHAWSGGRFPFEPPDLMVSRAYLKMAEGLAWGEIPIQAGDPVVEIGSSPGGASQRLLDLGLVVTGVDPAAMDPLILQHPRFEHWRSKSSAVKRKAYRKFKWLTADANVAPNYTLDAVEDIVQYPTSQFEGLLLTFKLTDYTLGERMEEYLDRIRSWGFSKVKARQLPSNRKECCVAALRGPAVPA